MNWCMKMAQSKNKNNASLVPIFSVAALCLPIYVKTVKTQLVFSAGKRFESKDLEKLMQAVMTTWLDSCNSPYAATGQSLLQCLQLMQDAAARLLRGKQKHDHHHFSIAQAHSALYDCFQNS